MRKNLQKLVYRQQINKMVAYIQHHLSKPIRLEKLADIAGFSRFHFHRIFTAFVGETLGEYTRRLRLEKGCLELLYTQRPVTEIALLIGYETPAAFDVLCSYLTKNNLWSKVGVCLSIYPDDLNLTPPEECRYDGGFVLKEGVDIQPEGEVQIQTILGGKYAIFLHKGPYETLWQTWNAIYRDWLSASGLKLRDVIPYEVYLKDKQKTKPEDLLTEIHLAIE